MPPRPVVNKQEQRRSILVIPSRIITRPDNLEGGEETEIGAQISVPQDGGWAWVVVFAAFFSVLILDGIAFTFGSLLKDISNDLKIPDSLTTLINSVSLALYSMLGPLVSGLINRFGFRTCLMAGSVISSFSLFTSYFATSFTSLLVFYGAFAGCGYSLINLCSALVVGFYFEKYRSIALSIGACGSSVGVMTLSPLNSYLVSLAGWRTTTLFHSGLFGIIFFLAMTFRPLLSLTVVMTTDDPTRTVTYLPNLSEAAMRATQSRGKIGVELMPTKTERLFAAVSNSNFPMAAAVVTDPTQATGPTNQPGPSAGAPSKLTLYASNPRGGISRRQLKQVQSAISKTSVQEKGRKIEIQATITEEKKKSFCARLCNWEPDIPESRPMYRDDAFYDGKLEKLPAYQKSMMDTGAAKHGLEYQLAVSRAAAATDLRERRGVFTTAVRRILATMMDPKLLSRCSFLTLSAGCFFIYAGVMVPYVYLQDRNKAQGISAAHCTWFVSVIGLSNGIGRLVLGYVAGKMDPIKLFAFCISMAGISTILSELSFSEYYQYTYCCFFGFFIASLSSVRCMVIVSLYGLENLTNAMGMILLFQGGGSLIGTPLAGTLSNLFGYTVAFGVAGASILLGGLLLSPIRSIADKEDKKLDASVQTAKISKTKTAS